MENIGEGRRTGEGGSSRATEDGQASSSQSQHLLRLRVSRPPRPRVPLPTTCHSSAPARLLTMTQTEGRDANHAPICRPSGSGLVKATKRPLPRRLGSFPPRLRVDGQSFLERWTMTMMMRRRRMFFHSSLFTLYRGKHIITHNASVSQCLRLMPRLPCAWGPSAKGYQLLCSTPQLLGLARSSLFLPQGKARQS